jgi:phytoene/squalene synthetase
LANFWQDISRDLGIGRIYLPQEDLRRFGYSNDELHGRVTNQAFLDLMRFQVDRTRSWLAPWSDKTLPELAPFPLRVQVDIELFARGGERILDRIAGIGYRVWHKRPVVTKGDVATLFAGCVKRAILRKVLWVYNGDRRGQ